MVISKKTPRSHADWTADVARRKAAAEQANSVPATPQTTWPVRKTTAPTKSSDANTHKTE